MKRLIIVDVSSFIFRAFFAIRSMSAPDGTPTNAVFGVFNMLYKLVSQYQPSHVIIAKDVKGGSFRNEMYSEYKANRGPAPEELVPQFALIDELLEKMNFLQIRIENYEADDVIGSAAVQFADDFDEIYIASGDKDLMQFVTEKVKMLDTMKDKIYAPADVFEKMGVHPDQIVDYLSLLGDASDNIPGVKGIGAKGAAKLLAEYKTLENTIANVANLKNKRVVTGLTEYTDDAYLSKSLIKIPIDLDLGVNAEDSKFSFSTGEELVPFLQKLGLNNAVKKIEAYIPEGGEPVQVQRVETNFAKHGDWSSIKSEVLAESSVGLYFQWDFRKLPIEEPKKKKVKKSEELLEVATEETVEEVVVKPFQFGLSIKDKEYLVEDEASLCEFLESYEGLIVLLDSKVFYNYTNFKKIKVKASFFDLMMAHFVMSPSSKHTLGFMADEFLSLNFEDKKPQDINLDEDCAVRMRILFDLYQALDKKLDELELQSVYSEIDLPLVDVLSKMEIEGVHLNKDYYAELETTFSEQVIDIKKQVEDIIGDNDVNLKSPKQVGVLLFETLGLPIIKKTKTGPSTDSEVLNTLADMGDSPVPGLILKLRELEKLLSTYVKALPKLIDLDSKKIHTTFLQTNAATGRLSSNEPNLQNIPVRTANGKLLRKGFYASEGHTLLAADYSQVELRILAHFSDDQIMLNAFKNNEDIHKQTASEIFGIPLDEITKDERGSAKAINFGLMYGQSSFGLSKQLGISRKEAKDYITQYFERFSKVKAYLDSLKEIAEDKGYSITMFGRKRFLPDIHSKNRTIKAMAERVAINSPIQGTAADIIKRAMINIDERLKKEGLKSKMILQVHDELIFDVPNDELSTMEKLVPEEMEGAVELCIPLKVEYGIGKNWFDLK
jgi:DNA polymerase-1